jgi:hypothetical protein
MKNRCKAAKKQKAWLGELAYQRQVLFFYMFSKAEQGFSSTAIRPKR